MVKKRETYNDIKDRVDNKGNLLCRIPNCNNLRGKYKIVKRFKKYCIEHNSFDMLEFTDWGRIRKKVIIRDNFTCVKCGYEAPKSNVFKYSYDISLLIADHIKPIALYGEQWDINNIQTLCIACNKIKTKQDMKDIAKLKRKEKSLSKGQTQL